MPLAPQDLRRELRDGLPGAKDGLTNAKGSLAGDGLELLRERPPTSYSEAEQQFSAFVQRKLYRLLRGEDEEFLLMRRYGGPEPDLAFLLPDGLDGWNVRSEVAERIIVGVLRFLDPFSPGGPIGQFRDNGILVETQTFPTHYPHIVVERCDVFNGSSGDCQHIEWRARRVQNQRKSTMVNRALDFGNLAFELARMIGMQ